MRPYLAFLGVVCLHLQKVTGQTYTSCNPLQGTCPEDPALAKALFVDFTSGTSDQFTLQGNPTYGSDGLSFTVARSGDSPQITSKFYIMFGKLEVTMKAAPGAGIVSSVVLQSDVLDEIDWEWLGADGSEVQTNYFGKGLTTSYNRGAFHANPNNQNQYQTYTIDWTANQIIWQIDGTTVRALTPANAETGQYPQTPMQVKIGAWSGGDSSNSQGTIGWARGPTDYSKGPFTFNVKSLKVTDYSTGTAYKYMNQDGTWQSIGSVGGQVNSAGGSVGGGSSSVAVASAPAVTQSSTGGPIPFEGTHRGTTTTYIRPNVYPWVARSTLSTSKTGAPTTYPGLPAGWTVTSEGKLIPPSSGHLIKPPSWIFILLLPVLTGLWPLWRRS